MNAADVMSRTVIAISKDAPLSQAVRLMVDERISGLPVLDADGHLVGMLTEGDLLQRVETGTAAKAPGWLSVIFTPGRLAGEYVQTHGRRVSDVMTPDPITIEETTPLAEVSELMRTRRVKRLPVTRDRTVIGIVSRADLVRALAKEIDVPAVSADDVAIRDAVLAELARQPWSPRRSLAIAVDHGLVDIDGVVFDVRERDAIRVAAENVPGVKQVANRLVVIEPNTGMLMVGPEQEQAEQDAKERGARG
jgi:CBS domain-containing protein